MPGRRIYYVPPRLVGSIDKWSGKDSPDGKSWLLDRAKALGFDTVWFSPFFETTHLKAATGEGNPSENSLYAIRGHGVLDPEFSATRMTGTRDTYTRAELSEIDILDFKHLEHFTQQAESMGMRVMAMADLVFNHVAADHPVAVQERAEIKAVVDSLPEGKKPVLLKKTGKDHDGIDQTMNIGMAWTDPATNAVKEYYFKFAYNDKLEPLDWQGKPNLETAQINFFSPAAKEFFIDGKANPAGGRTDGFWIQVVDWFMDRGMQDFRADVAYRVPPGWWQAIIEHAAQRKPDVFFMAETLGGSAHAISRMAEIEVMDSAGRERPGFDLGMLSNYWWNFTDSWLPQQEVPRLKKMAKFGGAAAPDNHDTPETLAGHFRKAFTGKGQEECDRIIADISVRNYAISSFIGNSVFMQMGYELSKETQNGVFKGQGSPQEWDKLVKDRPHGSVLNLEDRITAINKLKESLKIENTYVNIKEHKEMQDGRLIKMSLEYFDADTEEKKADVVLVINKKPEDGSVIVKDAELLGMEKSKLQRMGASGEHSPIVRDVLVYHTPPSEIAPSAQQPVIRAVKKAQPGAAP